MITEKELERINEIKEKKKWLEKLIKGFKDPYLIKTRLGLIKQTKSNKSLHKDVHDEAKVFDKHYNKLINRLERFIIIEMESDINDIDIELSKYIKQEVN